MDVNIKENDKITMTHTGLISGKNGKVIHVCFERKNDNKKDNDYAEILLPSRKVVMSKGFDEGEIEQLKLYLAQQEKSIIKNAKQINHDLIYKL
jgi:hypothetical protein